MVEETKYDVKWQVEIAMNDLGFTQQDPWNFHGVAPFANESITINVRATDSDTHVRLAVFSPRAKGVVEVSVQHALRDAEILVHAFRAALYEAGVTL